MENKTFIIAEIGVNHNGDMKIAKKMIDVAKECGVDAVKFQSFKTENIVKLDSPKAKYQIESTGVKESQYQMLKKLELSYENHLYLNDYCKKQKIMFLSTPFDIESLKLLVELNIPIIKIPSGEITNLPLLEEIGLLKKKVIMSTGMANLSEIKDALNILLDNGLKKNNITILHCNTQYPTPFEDVNLLAMKTIGDSFNVKVGYSDHTSGIAVSLAAVALGAKVIEKHFTLDKNMEGPDHGASIEPSELKELVSGIRDIESALGDGIKILSKSEQENLNVARKSIVAKCDIKTGEVFSRTNLTTKRPGDGISPMKIKDIYGLNSDRDYKKDDKIIF